MSTNFPSSVDAFTNPTSNDTLDNPPHDQQHADINDAMEAVQTSLLDGAPLHIDDANERVGIGTASPTYDLHVEGTGGFGAGTAAAAITTADTGNTAATLEFQADASAFDVTLFASGATPANAVYMNQRNNAPMVLMTNNTERMRIDSSGNIGINDTTPSYKLDVNGDINSQTDVLVGGSSLPRGYIGLTRLTSNLSIASGGSGLSFTHTCDPSRKYIMSITTVVYYTTANGYVSVVGTINGTDRAEGYFGVTTSSTYNSGTIWTREVSGLSGSVTFSATWYENGGNMYLAGNYNKDMTCIKIYDVGAA